MTEDEYDSSKETSDEAASRRPGVQAWDRLGQYAGRWNEAGKSIAERHLNAWKDLSADLRDPKYGADHWARGGARVLATALDDAQDLWRVWSPQGPPAVAGGIESVMLQFVVDDKGATGEDALPPVEPIAVPESVASPPPRPTVVVYGRSVTAAKNVQDAIEVKVDEQDDRTYYVQCQAPSPRKPLTPGVYTGLIFLESGPSRQPLADLRVVVQRRGDE